MKITYYTIDDLRLPPKRMFHRGWTIQHFDTVEEAIAHYQTLPPTGRKALGVMDGVHVLELVKCLPPYPDDEEGESVWASDYRTLTLWRERPESVEAAKACQEAFHPRYRLDGSVLIPMSSHTRLSERLRDKYLWLNIQGDRHSAVRWVYTAGKGWVPPNILYRRTDRPALVLKYQADGLTEQGAYLPLEVAPWEYDLLLQRTLERQNQVTQKGDRNDESTAKRSSPQ